MLNDIEIAQQAEMKNIKEVAAKLDIKEDDIEMYGKYKAKLSDELIASFNNAAIEPTAFRSFAVTGSF